MAEDSELDLTGPIPPELLGSLPHGWFERGWRSGDLVIPEPEGQGRETEEKKPGGDNSGEAGESPA